MQNPWLALPELPNWVLRDDSPQIESFNARNAAVKRADVRYRLDLFPEPYFGAPDAEIVLLALNPGASHDDAAWHAKPAFIEAARRSIAHQLAPLPFLHLEQPAESPGGKWWRRTTVPLHGGEETRVAAVARAVFCVQWFPYHSTRFASADLAVPTQEYNFALVRQAIRQKRTVIFLRSRKRWERSVPELVGYTGASAIRNPRNPTLSAANLPDGFALLADAVARTL